MTFERSGGMPAIDVNFCFEAVSRLGIDASRAWV